MFSFRYLKAYELRKPEGRRRSSPIFTFLTMKRLTVDIDNILKNMKKLNTFSACESISFSQFNSVTYSQTKQPSHLLSPVQLRLICLNQKLFLLRYL